MRCEDYPCCGHTDGLPCDWAYTPEAAEFDRKHAFCEHEAGFCEAEPDEDEHFLDSDDLDDDGEPWCYGCDKYGCDEMGYAEEPEDAFLDSYMEDRLTTMFEG